MMLPARAPRPRPLARGTTQLHRHLARLRRSALAAHRGAARQHARLATARPLLARPPQQTARAVAAARALAVAACDGRHPQGLGERLRAPPLSSRTREPGPWGAPPHPHPHPY